MGKERKRARPKPMSLPKRIFLYGGYIAFAALLLILFVTGLGPYDIPGTSRKLEDTIEVSRSLGLPLHETEVELKVPDESNAALIVVPAAERLRRAVPISFRSGLPSKVPTAESLELIGSAVDRASEGLDEIQECVDERKGWFVEKDLELGPNLTYPEFGQVGHAADLFRLRAFVRAKEGQIEQAIHDLDTSRRLGQHLATNSCMMGFLKGAAIEGQTLNMAIHLAHIWMGSAEAIEQLREWVQTTHRPLDVRNALKQEFFFGVAVVRNLSRYGGIRVVFAPEISHGGEEFVFNAEGLKRSGLPRGMWERAFLARFAHIYNVGFAPIKDQAHPKFGWTKALVAEYGRLDFSRGLSMAFAQMIIPYYQRLDERMAQVEASQSIALAVIDIHLLKLREGRLPRDLQELGHRYVDPFTGSSLLYKQTPDGFRVWSVDGDGKDDGGVTRDDPYGANVDLVAIVPPLPDKPFKP